MQNYLEIHAELLPQAQLHGLPLQVQLLAAIKKLVQGLVVLLQIALGQESFVYLALAKRMESLSEFRAMAFLIIAMVEGPRLMTPFMM